MTGASPPYRHTLAEQPRDPDPIELRPLARRGVSGPGVRCPPPRLTAMCIFGATDGGARAASASACPALRWRPPITQRVQKIVDRVGFVQKLEAVVHLLHQDVAIAAGEHDIEIRPAALDRAG